MTSSISVPHSCEEDDFQYITHNDVRPAGLQGSQSTSPHADLACPDIPTRVKCDLPLDFGGYIVEDPHDDSATCVGDYVYIRLYHDVSSRDMAKLKTLGIEYAADSAPDSHGHGLIIALRNSVELSSVRQHDLVEAANYYLPEFRLSKDVRRHLETLPDDRAEPYIVGLFPRGERRREDIAKTIEALDGVEKVTLLRPWGIRVVARPQCIAQLQKIQDVETVGFEPVGVFYMNPGNPRLVPVSPVLSSLHQ